MKIDFRVSALGFFDAVSAGNGSASAFRFALTFYGKCCTIL